MNKRGHRIDLDAAVQDVWKFLTVGRARVSMIRNETGLPISIVRAALRHLAKKRQARPEDSNRDAFWALVPEKEVDER